ncbi:hypothetical protein ACOSQ4_015729 [Xanthoceras sorbifolium]
MLSACVFNSYLKLKQMPTVALLQATATLLLLSSTSFHPSLYGSGMLMGFLHLWVLVYYLIFICYVFFSTSSTLWILMKHFLNYKVVHVQFSLNNFVSLVYISNEQLIASCCRISRTALLL